MEQGIVEGENILEVEEVGNLKGPPTRVVLQDKVVYLDVTLSLYVGMSVSIRPESKRVWMLQD